MNHTGKSPTILQLLPELNTGGVERGTVDMAAAIARRGWTSLVASAGGALESKLAHVGGEHLTLPLASKNPLTLWWNARRLERLIRERNVDILHARSRAPAWSAYLAAQRTGIPLITTFHGTYGLTPALKKRYNAVMTYGEPIIAVSHFIAEHIMREYGVDEARIRVIARGVDMALFAPDRVEPTRLESLLHDWKLPEDDRPILLVPGRMTRWKGQDVVLRALAQLPHQDYQCLLVGPMEKHPAYVQELRALIATLGLTEQVRIMGGTPHMTEAYALASLVLVPSTAPEAFGRVPVEAQAMGVPVITTAHGGACETVLDGLTGWLVPPGDAQALAGAIDMALRLDPQRREEMAVAARAHVQDNFSLEQMQEATLAVYEKVLLGDGR